MRPDEACEVVLKTIAPEWDPETPVRMLRALGELTEGYLVDPGELFKTFEAPKDSGIVAVKGIPFASLCEHHVLPFTGMASVAYIPRDRVIGLSKIPRLVRALTRRLQLQERIGQEIADAMVTHLDPVGVMVVIKAHHTCMGLRGIESPGEMVTSCVRGAFAEEHAARSEALALMGMG